jgi:hypothetical protein
MPEPDRLPVSRLCILHADQNIQTNCRMSKQLSAESQLADRTSEQKNVANFCAPSVRLAKSLTGSYTIEIPETNWAVTE